MRRGRYGVAAGLVVWGLAACQSVSVVPIDRDEPTDGSTPVESGVDATTPVESGADDSSPGTPDTGAVDSSPADGGQDADADAD